MRNRFALLLFWFAVSLRLEGILGRIALYIPPVEFTKPSEEIYYGGKGDGCKVSMNEDLNPNQPLFVVPGTENFFTPLPNTTDLHFQHGEQLELFCTGGFKRNKVSLSVTCDRDDLFDLDGTSYSISKLSCKAPVFHVAIRTEQRCFNNATIVKVGFELDARFITLYEACFDEYEFRTYYVKHALSPWNVKQQTSKRPSFFIQEDFFGELEVADLYSFNTQRQTLGRILGSQVHADTFLDKRKDFFLARGHYAANADFVYGSHKRATFWYLNVAPQWQRFNGVNWQRVEAGVKDFVARRNLNVTVYTGTYGILELPDVNGDAQKIYLDFDPDNGGRIPVPKYYYKILHDEVGDAGIVLVGVNNPHAKLEDLEENYVFCKNVLDEIDWLKWKPEDVSRGYSFACDVNEFNAVTRHLPELGPVGKLLI